MSRRSFALLVAVLVLSSLVMISCTQTPPPPAAQPDTRAADQKVILDGEAAWMADWNSHDVERILSHYADDAIFMEQGIPAMKGKDAFRKGLGAYMRDMNFAITFTPTRVEVSRGGDLAYSYGTNAVTFTNPKTKKPVTSLGKYVVVYKKQADGTWKAILDIPNSDAPVQ